MPHFNEVKKHIKNNRLLYLLLYPIIFIRRLIVWRKGKVFETFYSSLFESVEKGCLAVRVPDFGGIFEVDLQSHILRRLLRDKNYEPELVMIVKAYVDSQKDVLDIGANIGLFTVLLSKTISGKNRVLAVEPTPLALHYLRRNIERNDIQNIIVFEGVATNKKGNFVLNTISGMEEYSSLGEIVNEVKRGRPTESIEVKGDTVDNLVREYNLNPGFIKIDAEGAECLVFSGALGTIKKYKPVIISELSESLLANFGETSETIFKFLRENGYQIINPALPGFPVKSPFSGEFLAIPIV